VIDTTKADIVIVLTSKNDTIFGPSTKIYVRNKNELEQIGVVQKMSLTANCKDLEAELSITFPKEVEGMSDIVKEVINKNCSLLADMGCKTFRE
jgi:hypothetical protein